MSSFIFHIYKKTRHRNNKSDEIISYCGFKTNGLERDKIRHKKQLDFFNEIGVLSSSIKICNKCKRAWKSQKNT